MVQIRRRLTLVTIGLSVMSIGLVLAAVTRTIPVGLVPRAPEGVIAAIPHLNAVLSVTAIGTIGGGIRAIRTGRIRRHRRAMLTALVLFATFLLLYLYRVALHGPTSFGGPEPFYTWVYLPILAIHMLLAIVCIPLLYYVVLLGLTRPISIIGETPHPRVGRVAAGLWITSFALGLVVYLLLYWIY